MNTETLDFEQQTEQTGFYHGNYDDPNRVEQMNNARNPQTPNDFADDFVFRRPDGVLRNADRYIFFPGDLMTPELKRERPDFHLGGEFFGTDYPALSLSKYALMRCRITPIVLRPRPFPADEPIKNGELEQFGDTVISAPGGIGRVKFVKAYPGDQLDSIIFGNRAGENWGYAELKALRGKEFALAENKALLNDVQQKIFPDWMRVMRGETRLPETLRGIEQMIGEAAAKHSGDELIPAVCADMLGACDVFRRRGTAYLETEAIRVRAGVNQQGGYVHRYSQVANLLLIQLEMKRESLLELPDTTAQEKTADALTSLTEVMRQNAELMAQNQALLGKALSQSATAGVRSAEEATEPKTKKNK